MGYNVIFDILTASVIGGIILLNLIKLNQNIQDAEATTMLDVNLQVEVINAANIIEGDFNKIGYCANPANTNDLPKVTLGDSSSVKIVFDTDKNGFYDTVYYFLSDTSILSSTPNPEDRLLYRQVNSDVPLMISNRVTDFSFTYLDALYDTLSTPLISPGLASYIKIAIRVEDPFTFSDDYNEAYWRRLTVTAKNLKRN